MLNVSTEETETMHDYGWSPMFGMWVFWLLIVALVVVAVWWGSRSLSGKSQQRSNDSPEDILKKRYARGEIDKDEYAERMKDLNSPAHSELEEKGS